MRNELIIRPQRLLREGLLTAALKSPEKVALVIEGKAYTYKTLMDVSLRLATALKERGVKQGDRVAIYMDNTWPCVVSIYAVLFCGGVFLVVNPQTKADKLAFVLDDSDAKVLISDAHLATVFEPIINRLGKLSGVIFSGELPPQKPHGEIPIEKFDDLIEQCSPLQEPVHVIPNDLAALIYTSGSTGNPKGVMHTHQTMVFAAWSLIEYLRLNEADRILLVLPIAFDYGLYQLLMTVKLGATLIVERSFTFPAQIYARILDEKATVFPGVPTIFAMLISAHKREKLCFPSVTTVTNTAAALPADFVPHLREIFPNALIFKMYGLTECKRVSYLEPELLSAKPTSVGKAIPGTEVYLLSLEGNTVPTGEAGILYVRGPHIMLGYWKQPELSAKMLKDGAWPGERVLCTHDWFRMDDEGYLYFVGRSDDIIKSRGEKISPVEVENVLHGIQGIKEVAVVGMPDEILGQAVCAFVVLDQGQTLSDRLIKKECLARLENFMVPKKIVVLDELPKTNTGKTDKQALSELASHG